MTKKTNTITLRILKKRKINKHIWNRINKRFRRNMKPYAYDYYGTYYVPVDVLSNDNLIKKYYAEHIAFDNGEYVVLAYQHRKGSNKVCLTKKIFAFTKIGSSVSLRTYKRFSYFWFRRKR